MSATEPWDIEDLVEAMRQRPANSQCCPYFVMNRKLPADAVLIVCPYNYLIGIAAFDNQAMLTNVCRPDNRR